MPNNYPNKYARAGKIKTIRAYKHGKPVFQTVDRWRLVRLDLSKFYQYKGLKV